MDYIQAIIWVHQVSVGMQLFFEKGRRSGTFCISNRYSKANN